MNTFSRSTLAKLQCLHDLQSAPVAKLDAANWMKYSAAFASAMAFATSAEASIIHTTGPVATTTLTDFNQHATATVNNGLLGASFQMKDQIFAPNSSNVQSASGVANLIGLNGHLKFATYVSQNMVQKLAAGATIDSGNSFASNGLLAINFPGNNVGDWGNHGFGQHNDTIGYAGLEILQGGNTYYGWVKLDVQTIAEVNKITALEWAYNNVAGQSIAAGDVGAAPTPEPGTEALSLLALGAVGVAAWRRRNNASAAA